MKQRLASAMDGVSRKVLIGALAGGLSLLLALQHVRINSAAHKVDETAAGGAAAAAEGANTHDDANSQKSYVAWLDDNGYVTFEEAWAALSNAVRDFTITRDIETVGTFVAPEDPTETQATTLFLDGHTLRIAGGVQVPKGASLSLGNHEDYDTGTIATDIDNKGSLAVYSSSASQTFTVRGNLRFTDNGETSNTMRLSARVNIEGYYITDLHSIATLGAGFGTDQPLRLWIVDNDELVTRLNSGEPMSDVAIFNGGSADVAKMITIGGDELSLPEGVTLRAIYNSAERKIYLHKAFGAEYEATIGATSYASLDEAIEAAKDAARGTDTEKTITIVAPYDTVTCDYGYTTVSGQNLTIDLNGHKVASSRADGYMFYLGADSSLTLVDSSDGSGTVAGHLQASDGCAITADGITISGSISGDARSITLNDAPVTGSVSAGADGTVELRDSSVGGSVGAKTVSIVDTKASTLSIGGSVIVTGGSFAYEGAVDIAGKLSLASASASLNGRTGSLRIEMDHTCDIALGDDFAAQSIECTLSNADDLARLNSPEKAEDYVIFTGGDADVAGMTRLAAESFTNPTLAVVYVPGSGTGSGKVVIHKNRGIFLNGQKGNDSYAGTMTRPVRTFAKALALWLANPGEYDGIYISGTVEVSGDETWDGKGVTVYRYPGRYDRLENNATYAKQGFFYTSSDSHAANVPCLVFVTGTGGSLTLRNITIDGNANVTASENGGPLVAVVRGATLNIEGGATLQNSNISGSSMTSEGGAVNADASTVRMSGGVVRGNTAKSGGGLAFHGGTFVMLGGVIQGNTANEFNSQQQHFGSGGGVSLQHGAQMSFMWGQICDNHAEGAGGGIAVGVINDPSAPGSTLSMTGGEVNGNTSRVVGGGIFIQCNNEADLTGGFVTANHTNGETSFGVYGGGGIYVNYDYDNAGWIPGRLSLTKAIVTANEAETYGGGLAGCPNSDVRLYSIDGGAIYGNHARGASEVSIDINPTAIFSGNPQVEVSPFMLGGGAYLWKDESGEYVSDSTLRGVHQLMLHNDHEEGDAEVTKACQADPRVFITGNTSGTRGGGIGTNGTVIVGKPSAKEGVSVSARKVWSEAASATGRMRLVLERKRASETDDAYRPVGYQVIDGETYEWTYVFEGMPQVDSFTQEAFDYRVVEDESYVVDGARVGESYRSDVVYDEKADCWVITNSQKAHVEVAAQWDDADNRDGIRPTAVTVQLMANGSLTGLSLQLTEGGDWKGSFDNLDAYKEGDPISYTVTEDVVEGYEASMTGSALGGFVMVYTHAPEPVPGIEREANPDTDAEPEPDVEPAPELESSPEPEPESIQQDVHDGRMLAPLMSGLVLPFGIITGMGTTSVGLRLTRRKRRK